MVSCSMNTDGDTDDLFNAVYSQELNTIEKGYNDGFAAGRKNGFEEGISLGKNQGSKVARELGYYFGFCQTFILQINNKDVSKSELKAISIFKEIVSDIKAINNYDPIILKDVFKIHLRFKQASALLKLNKNVVSDVTSSDLTSF